jgi:hypothetical protein
MWLYWGVASHLEEGESQHKFNRNPNIYTRETPWFFGSFYIGGIFGAHTFFFSRHQNIVCRASRISFWECNSVLTSGPQISFARHKTSSNQKITVIIIRTHTVIHLQSLCPTATSEVQNYKSHLFKKGTMMERISNEDNLHDDFLAFEEGNVFVLPDSFVPGKWDVICQRGKECFEHGT